MPSYDYQCRRCDTRFEARHPISAPRPPCPDCGGQTERVILYAPAVHGYMARGREQAVRTLEPPAPGSGHGPRCPCCH
jgi:putative FmdB family regulatory protein